jgi:hypothetical protein
MLRQTALSRWRTFEKTPAAVRKHYYNRGGNLDSGPHNTLFAGLFFFAVCGVLFWVKQAFVTHRASVPTRQMVYDRFAYDKNDGSDQSVLVRVKK